jgi:plastocyanin
MQFLSLKRKQYIAVGSCACLVIIIIVGFLIWHHTRHNSVATTQTTHKAIIDITPSGFVPTTLNVTPGTVIVWQNQDSATHKVASNPYPLDNSVPSLNSGAILPNSSYHYKVTSAGTIHYHDDTDPTVNGTIVVEK